jgi:hypothetical protein
MPRAPHATPTGTLGAAGPSWRTVGWLGIGCAVVAAVLAFGWHPIEVPGAENDRYVEMVEHVLAGRAVADAFHPAHLPLLGALLALPLGGDAFAALRLVSALAGGALVAGTWLLARRVATPRAAAAATAFVALHPLVVTMSLQACTDVLAAALVTWAAVATRAAASGRPAAAGWLGLAFGLAWGTRTNVLGAAPLLLAPLLAGDRRRRLPWLLLGLVVGYAPQAGHGLLAGGALFPPGNWRNVVLKHSGFDRLALHESSFGSFGEFLVRHGLDVLGDGAATLARFLCGGFAETLWCAPAASAWALPLAVLGTAALAGGAVVIARDGGGRVLLAAAAAFVALVCVTFVPMPRLVLPVFPLAAAALAAGAAAPQRWLGSPCRVALALGLGAVVVALPARWLAFVADHPHAEIAAAARMHQDPAVERVAATYAVLDRHVAFPCALAFPPGGEAPGDDPLAHFRLVQDRTGADGFVIGRRSAPAWFHRLGAEPLPAWLRVVQRDDDVLGVHCPFERVEAGAWIEAATAEPAVWTEGPLVVAVRLAATAPLGDVRRVVAVDPRLLPKGPMLDLPRVDDRTFRGELRLQLPPGRWPLRIRLTLAGARHAFGPELAVDVR